MERMGETEYVSDRGNWVYCSAWGEGRGGDGRVERKLKEGGWW